MWSQIHILVAFDRFQKPLKNRVKKLQNSSLNVATNMTTNVTGTWPRTWPEHESQMVQWPRCNVASELNRHVGHVPATLNMAAT